MTNVPIKIFKKCLKMFKYSGFLPKLPNEAAKKLGCSFLFVRATLRQIEKKAPQLFPILTPRHRAILLMYDQHMSRASIAVALGISEQELNREVAFLRKHKFLWNRKMDQYDPLVDGQVKERF